VPRPDDTAVAGASTGALRVLLVEDQRDLRETTLQLLEMLDCDATAAADAEAAELLLAQKAFDVMITDVTLPGRSGVELAIKAHRDLPALKIIFCSGYGAPAGLPPGMPSWSLAKPYAFADLEALLGQLRQHRR
jgi:CheY-like chemotaxis protein